MEQRPFKTLITTFSSVAGAVLLGVFFMACTVASLRYAISHIHSKPITTTNIEPAVIEPVHQTPEIGPKIPGVTAESYMAVNILTGVVDVEHNVDRTLPIASVSKLYTAVIAKEQLDPRKVVTITGDALETEGNTAKFKLNEKISVENLFYPLLMVSSNDAAEALARAAGRDAFITAMNHLAENIGATATRFADPSGLSQGNVSTARELARFVAWLYIQHPEIIDITKLKSKSIRAHTWTNPTHYLNIAAYAGGKNGFTDEAERTAVSLFMIPNDEGVPEPHVIVVLRSMNRDKDVLGLLHYISGGKM